MTTPSPSAARFVLGRVIVTLMVLVAVVASVRLQTYRLPFARDSQSRFATVSALADLALPASLRPGDQIVFGDQDLRVRSLLVAPDVPPDTAYPFVIRRGGQVLSVAVSTVPGADDGRFLSVVNLVTVIVISLLGLVTLWRGTSWAAWGLTVFAGGILCGSTVAQTPVAPFGNVVCLVAAFFLTGPLPFIGLYLTALDLTGRAARSRPLLTLLFAVGAAGLFACQVLIVADMLVYGSGAVTSAFNVLSGVFAVLMLGVPLLVLSAGYVGARADQRLRIRWVLASTALLIPLLLLSVVDQLHLVTRVGTEQLVTVARAVLTALIFGLYAYAVLSQRLVQVRIVVNRAVVFSALMMIVVGALGAVENLIERSALGESAGAALEFGVPLAIGVLFQRLHRWIEARVEQILFREEHKSRAALRDFVRDAGFVENADVLVGRMVAIFAKHAGGRGAALYELRGNGMECSAQDGNDRWPDVIDVDDPGLVRLRATLGPVDLHEVESALGREGLALPLALRGRIFGVLVCGPRAAGRYAQAEAAELGQAAHDVGASLFALRARANEVLIEKLAQGQVQVDRAVVEARKLAGMM
jgi:hypothetical protein